jgi:hypothetical protein
LANFTTRGSSNKKGPKKGRWYHYDKEGHYKKECKKFLAEQVKSSTLGHRVLILRMATTTRATMLPPPQSINIEATTEAEYVKLRNATKGAV